VDFHHGSVTPDYRLNNSYYDVWISYNKGYNWVNLINTPDKIMGVGFDLCRLEPHNNGLVLVAGRVGGVTTNRVFRSDDEGKSWYELVSTSTNANAPINTVYFPHTQLSNGDIILLKDSNLFRSTDGGNNWVATPTNVSSSVASQLFGEFTETKSGDILYSRNSELYRSTNQGITWTTVFASNFPDASGITNHSLNTLDDGTILLINATTGNVFRSTNNGTNWTNTNSPLPTGGSYRTVQLSTGRVITINNTAGGTIHYSDNRGLTWTLLTTVNINIGFHFRCVVTKNDTIVVHGGSGFKCIGIFI
jgi:photosystem II stability/assembly factor-like uncharacterized protein